MKGLSLGWADDLEDQERMMIGVSFISNMALARGKWLVLGLWIILFLRPGQIGGQDLGEHGFAPFDAAFARSDIDLGPLAQKVVITDAPGRKGKEFGDTTIYVNSELRLYAALYNNGKYKSEAKVDWFWADTSSHQPTPIDTSQYLGFGSSILFKPKHVGAGFIFVKNLSNAIGDSTGSITIITLEKLTIDTASSDRNTITQGQENVYVWFDVENVGEILAKIQEASLGFLKNDSIRVSDQYSVHRIDTVTLVKPGEKRRFEFLVDVDMMADTGKIYVVPHLMTDEANYQGIESKLVWQVQWPPILQIDWIEVLTEQVFPSQQDVFVVMHISNQGGATVGAVRASLTFWRNGQDVSGQYRFRMSDSNPHTIPGKSSAQFQLIVDVEPTATYGTVVINGSIAGQDINTGMGYEDIGADRPGSWLVTQTLSQVGIISTRVTCPNVDFAGDGQVNLGQQYGVEVVVQNQGTEDVLEMSVSLRSNGNSKWLDSPSQQIPRLLRAQVDTFYYALEAWAEEIPSIEQFVARIDSSRSPSSALVIVSAAVDSLAQVKILEPAHVSLHLKADQLTIPVASSFRVTASVTHPPESASFDSTGQLAIQLPANYDLTLGDSVRSFQPNENVSWSIRAPSFPSEKDTITISIRQAPRDRNNPEQFAHVDVPTRRVMVNVMEATIAIADVAVISPRGAMDNLVSTDQLMQVRAKITSNLVEQITVQLIAPDSFELLANSIQPLIGDTVAWWLRAPAHQTTIPQSLKIQAWGHVMQDPTRMVAVADSSLHIQTMARADLKVVARIIEPASALQGRISPGMAFTIQGEIVNLGQAGIYGARSLRLDLPDRRLVRVAGDSIISVEDHPALWTLRADEQIDPAPKIIKIWLQDIPFDDNSDEEAWVSDENHVADVPILFSTINLVLMVRQLPGRTPKALAPGITEKMISMEFLNLSSELGYPISIRALKFDIEDDTGHPLDPASVLTELRIIDEQMMLGKSASLADNPVEVMLTSPIVLGANQKRQIAIEVDCSPYLAQTFRIQLKDPSSLSIQSLAPITFVDESRNPVTVFNLRSSCPTIIANDLRRSFRNYPNPFGSGDRPMTHFIYYLSQESDIELKIYSLMGELVWRCQYSRNQPQGRRGLHQADDISWDGRNLRGHRVLNGVYIARIATSAGESALTKVAVIK